MQKNFRTHSKKIPEFHHYDLPEWMRKHNAFNFANLMQQKNHLLIQSGSTHCRITFCQQFENFKIIRPDDIDNEQWKKIKIMGESLVRQHIDWYASPLPRTAPASLQKTFLYNFSTIALEDGEAQDAHETEIFAKWRRMDSNDDVLSMLEHYFDHFAAMRSHPMLYAIICGRMVPTLQDLKTLLHFKSIFTLASINALFDSFLNTSYAFDFCKGLFKRNVYPQLSDVDGHLTFEIAALKSPSQVVDLLNHDLNIDLLVLRAFSKEANFLQQRNPGAAHMIRVLPSHIYKIFDFQDRITYLTKTEFWDTYHYTQIVCSGPDRQRHQDIPRQKTQSFSICNFCKVQCARSKINCNWIAIYSAIPTIRNSQSNNIYRRALPNSYEKEAKKRALSPEPIGYEPKREKRARITFTDGPQQSTMQKEEQKKTAENNDNNDGLTNFEKISDSKNIATTTTTILKKNDDDNVDELYDFD